MRNITLTKEMKGQRLYALGDSNAKKRDKNPLYLIEVVSVARVNVVIRFVDSGRELSLTASGMGKANFNYKFYLSVDDFRADHFTNQMIDALRYQRTGVVIPAASMIQIGELLGLDMNVDDLVIGETSDD